MIIYAIIITLFAILLLVSMFRLAQKVKLNGTISELEQYIQTQKTSSDELAETLIQTRQALSDDIAQKQILQSAINELRDTQQALEIEKAEQLGKLKSEIKFEADEYRKQQEQELLTAQKDFVENFTADNKAKLNSAKELVAQIEQLRANVSSAVELSKRNFEEAQQRDFYRLQLSEDAIADIKNMREIEGRLHNAEPLNKVIWKVYYEKPYTDLIGRVIGSKTLTGIYKITNIETKQCYIGQAVNIGR